MNKIEKLVREEFGSNYEIGDIALRVFDRMELDDFESIDDFDEIDEELTYAMNDELIYNNDLWEIIKYYCVPTKPNYEMSMECFYDDLFGILHNYYEN